MSIKLLWLEDHPELNSEIKNELESSNFELVLCKNLEEFGEKVKKYKDTPDQVAGFVLDVVIPAKDLGSLGMPQIIPQNGAETGYAILRHYLRNIRDRSPIKNIFKVHPVLILSVMSEFSMETSFITKKDDQTTWLCKTNSNGHSNLTCISINKWLKKLNGSN